MFSILLPSLLDPLFWMLGCIGVWCGYRLPRRSWIRFLLTFSCFPGMIGVIALQVHLLRVLDPGAFYPRMVDYVLFPDIICGLLLMILTAVREERAKEPRQPAGRR